MHRNIAASDMISSKHAKNGDAFDMDDAEKSDGQNSVPPSNIPNAIAVRSEEEIEYFFNGGFAQQLLDISPVQIYAKNLSRQYVYLNTRAWNLLKSDSCPHPIGVGDKELVSDAVEYERFKEEDDLTIQSLERREVVEDWTPNSPDSNGDFRRIRTTRYPIVLESDQSRAIGVVSVSEDISHFSEISFLTKSLQLEKQTVDNIVTLITHDWVEGLLTSLHRTLGNALQWAADNSAVEEERVLAAKLLELSGASMEFKPFFENERVGEGLVSTAASVFIAVDFMLSYIDHLADYAGSQRGKAVILRNRANVRRDIFEYMQVYLAQTRHPISVKFDELDDNLFLYCDVRLLRIVVHEMCQNHKKHGCDDFLIVKCRQSLRDLSIDFFSRGSEIEPQLRTLMWQRGTRSETAASSGSGFGLDFIRRAVESQGGKVDSRRENDMNVFSLILPIGSVT
jgi:hypothetical protein